MSSKRMGDLELQTIIDNELKNALGQDGGQLSSDRRKFLEYYEGQPLGNEQPGQSQVVSRNVLEAVEWVLPALLRVFGIDKIVEFEPIGPEDEAVADQATEYINFILTHDNDFVMIAHDWFKDALIQRVGYVKVYWNTQKTYTTNSFTGLNDLEYQQLSQTDDVEVIEHESYPNPDPNFLWFEEDTPELKAPELHDVKLRVWQTQGRVKIENIAPEEILVSRRAPSTVLDGTHFVCHRTLKTVSEMRELYPDSEDLIEDAVGNTAEEWNTERIARFVTEDEWPYSNERNDDAMREVWLEDSYISVDYDGDGFAELRRVVTARNGAIVFENTPVDDVPIIAICPIPMPHKHIGLGLGDLTADLQEIKSSLLRQSLNNLYLTNSPRFVIDEMAMTDESVDDLLNVRPGGIIRVSNVQGIQPLEVPFVAQGSLPIIQYIDETQEIRTGVSRRNVGLSPDDLNRTATAVNAQQNSAAQRAELIATVFAQQGIKPLAKKILGLITKYQQQARIVRITGKWVPFDPKNWKNSLDVNVTVGLGTGNRDQVLMHLMNILQIQQQAITLQGGIQGPLVTAQNVYDVVSKLVENSGFKTPFFTDPKTIPPQPPGQQKPSPQMMKAQADVQAKQMKTQADIQGDQAKAQIQVSLEAAKSQHAMQLEQVKADHQMQLEQAREQNKMEIEAMRQRHQANIDTFNAVNGAANGAF